MKTFAERIFVGLIDVSCKSVLCIKRVKKLSSFCLLIHYSQCNFPYLRRAAEQEEEEELEERTPLGIDRNCGAAPFLLLNYSKRVGKKKELIPKDFFLAWLHFTT